MLAAAICLFFAAAAPKTAPPPPPPDLTAALKPLKFREIGPAVMGGRIDDVAVVESDPDIVYVATASGGAAACLLHARWSGWFGCRSAARGPERS